MAVFKCQRAKSGCLGASRRFLVAQQCGDAQEMVGQHRRPRQNFEALPAFRSAALHPPAAKQHRDATFDADAKALPFWKAGLRSKVSRSAVFCLPRWGMQIWLTPAFRQSSSLPAL